MGKYTSTAGLSLLGCLAMAATAFGHANFKPKDVDPLYANRTYKEGTTAYVSLVASHGCRDEEGVAHATRDVYAVFPNAVDLSGVGYSQGSGSRYAGNALMAIKPEQDSRFRRIERVRGPVPEFYSHGPKSQDVRALHWRRGYLPDDVYAELKFRAALPRLEGCVDRLRVYIPAVQYCTGGLVNAWIREATDAFGTEMISAGYAPYIDVLRDYDNNPLPEACDGGEQAEAYPSSADIDRYLVRARR